MGRLMPRHVGRIPSGFVPTPDVLERLIEKTDLHWYWEGDFADDGDLRYAVLRIEHATCVVARLMWEHANNASLHRRQLRNDCGLVTCVRPDHFTLIERKAQRFALPEPCVLSTGEIVRVIRADFDTTHILIEGTQWFACHRQRGSMTHVVSNETMVSCEKCIKAWRSLQRPLVVCP